MDGTRIRRRVDSMRPALTQVFPGGVPCLSLDLREARQIRCPCRGKTRAGFLESTQTRKGNAMIDMGADVTVLDAEERCAGLRGIGVAVQGKQRLREGGQWCRAMRPRTAERTSASRFG
jgi:hypothetical protein